MFVPDPVISPAMKPIGTETPNFTRALNHFQKEDPTFRVHIPRKQRGKSFVPGPISLETDRASRRSPRAWASYTSKFTSNRRNASTASHAPPVARRLHSARRLRNVYTQKQSGGAGQYARVIGHIGPIEMDTESGKDTEFESAVMGGNVPSNYIPVVEKGFYEALEKGTLSGNLISGVRVVLQDGTFHAVDS